MNIQTKSSNGITLVPIESRLLSERKVFLEGEIKEDGAMEFIRKLMCLAQEDAEAGEPVSVPQQRADAP